MRKCWKISNARAERADHCIFEDTESPLPAGIEMKAEYCCKCSKRMPLSSVSFAEEEAFSFAVIYITSPERGALSGKQTQMNILSAGRPQIGSRTCKHTALAGSPQGLDAIRSVNIIYNTISCEKHKFVEISLKLSNVSFIISNIDIM